jgi:hypothetical protein
LGPSSNTHSVAAKLLGGASDVVATGDGAAFRHSGCSARTSPRLDVGVVCAYDDVAGGTVEEVELCVCG